MCGTENEAAGQAPNSAHPAQNHNPDTSPYQRTEDDNLSNVGRYKIIESTLREGEQFANAFFTTEMKCKIATMLSDFGVDYIEITSPVSSPQSYEDCKTICKLGLKAKILTHVRCNLEDAKKAVECGVDGVDLVIGTSSFLREYSHGKSMEVIQKTAIEVIEYVKSKGVEVRFSSEDSFRSDLVDLLTLYKAVDKAGVGRVGVADTVGGATPRMVYDLVRTLRRVVSCDIETHFHNDTGCAVGNAISALEAGATHIDTSVLGIGESALPHPPSCGNGITPLGALMARMVVSAPEYTKSKYNLKMLKEIEEYVASCVQVNIPFNNPITGATAEKPGLLDGSTVTHKAGIHAKAILANPSTYEIIDPSLFGLTRYISITSRITGWNAVKSRVVQLGYELTDDQIKEVYVPIPPDQWSGSRRELALTFRNRTFKIKQMADIRPLAIDDTDSIIHAYHLNLQQEKVASTA
ncbi:Homocitrate synthase, mitochondrial [Neonectria ditissima]|uniref:homocitrate synthase n=1 Tax=Neonectria ditissima TaxID=78410 RepID=A0A0P7BYT9_9HYPO|nr:Homocitrate synthase, mitochondrial [Neonectria ditissima]